MQGPRHPKYTLKLSDGHQPRAVLQAQLLMLALAVQHQKQRLMARLPTAVASSPARPELVHQQALRSVTLTLVQRYCSQRKSVQG